MSIYKFLVAGLLAFVFIGCSADKAQLLGPEYNTNEKSKKINELHELLVVSGGMQALPDISRGLGTEIEKIRKKSKLSQTQYNQLRDTAVNAFSEDNILKSILIDLDKKLSEEEIKVLQKEYNSLFMTMIRMHENNGLTQEARKKAESLDLKTFKDKEKLESVQQMQSLMGLTDFTLDLVYKMSQGLFIVHETSKNPDKALDMELINKMARFVVNKEKANAEQKLTKMFVFAYKDLPMEDMKKYNDWLSKPHVQKFITGFNSAFAGALSKSIEEIIQSEIVMNRK